MTTVLHGPIDRTPWKAEQTVNLSITDEPEERRWITTGTGTTRRTLGPTPRRTPVRSAWPAMPSQMAPSAVRRVAPSRTTQSTLERLRSQEPLLWTRAGSSISWQSESFRKDAEYRRSQRGKRIVKVEREHTRYSTHTNSLDRILPEVDWTDQRAVVPRTDPILTGTRETARKVRAQFGHLGGRSRLDSPRNQDSKLMAQMIANQRARKR